MLHYYTLYNSVIIDCEKWVDFYSKQWKSTNESLKKDSKYDSGTIEENIKKKMRNRSQIM